MILGTVPEQFEDEPVGSQEEAIRQAMGDEALYVLDSDGVEVWRNPRLGQSIINESVNAPSCHGRVALNTAPGIYRGSFCKHH